MGRDNTSTFDNAIWKPATVEASRKLSCRFCECCLFPCLLLARIPEPERTVDGTFVPPFLGGGTWLIPSVVSCTVCVFEQMPCLNIPS